MREYNNDFRCEDCRWMQSTAVMDKDGNESLEWIPVDITAVPVGFLLREWEDLVFELSEMEMELYQLKEDYLHREKEIIATTDFKEIYGANNQKVRDQHVKETLKEMVQRKTTLQFSIDFIRAYIPLLRECIRSKQ